MNLTWLIPWQLLFHRENTEIQMYLLLFVIYLICYKVNNQFNFVHCCSANKIFSLFFSIFGYSTGGIHCRWVRATVGRQILWSWFNDWTDMHCEACIDAVKNSALVAWQTDAQLWYDTRGYKVSLLTHTNRSIGFHFKNISMECRHKALSLTTLGHHYSIHSVVSIQ